MPLCFIGRTDTLRPWPIGRPLGSITVPAVVLAGLLTGAPASHAAAAGPDGTCSAGARTLAAPGSVMYPDTGNGGYTSVHTDVDLVYDATGNSFLPGNHVVLHDRATQCLTSFSLDFERTSPNQKAGPDMKVSSVLVNGKAARYAFAQPTYPGDPHGQDDPSPLAHEMSQTSPVGGPRHNPLPPACSPELLSQAASQRYAHDGWPCPANKLVITPPAPVKDGAGFTVTVYYTGRPGTHNDGDGTLEGWFRAPDGSLVSTEPVGSEDWMPLNDYPTAKPSYDFADTVNAGKTAVANGILTAVTQHHPDAEFPGGSTTWNWSSPEPIASYLVQSSVGNYRLTEQTSATGIRFYQAQDAAIPAARQRANRKIIDYQWNITAWESQFAGPYPFSSDGVVVGTPVVDSGQEEMQTMISFNHGMVDMPTLYHENFHQWWGDNVTEHGYQMTFYKEGFGQLAQYLLRARNDERRAGGPGTKAGVAAFNRTLIRFFDETYAKSGSFWTVAPSDPAPWNLFDNPNTYLRPAAVYIALRQILGAGNWDSALQQIQRVYGGATITEPQEEAVFHDWLPVKSVACQSRLTQFFSQWFDTAYPSGGTHKPQITGPGLDGPGFYDSHGGC
jgi:Peptidase family M1 domain